MSFGFWHSIYANLPDAKVIVASPNNKIVTPFKWSYRCKIPFHTYSKNTDSLSKFFPNLEVISLPSNLLALRPYVKNELGPISAKSEESSTFVDYSTCGKFVLSQRIDSYVSPFGRVATRLSGEGMTINESKVLAYWDSLDLTYKAVS